MRRTIRALGSTNRYTDGTGRKLDTNVIPREIYQPAISNRAYPRTSPHWQLTVAGEPTPYKGNVIVSGAGVVGQTAACLFALRGWHVTVVEQRSNPLDDESLPMTSHQKPIHPTEFALMTKRAVDVLGHAGVSVHELRQFGAKVTGVLDHPGAYNTLLTRGLTEHHKFAVNMLSVNLQDLQKHMASHMLSLPTADCRTFYDHKIVSVRPDAKRLTAKPLRDFEAEGFPTIPMEVNSAETSLSMHVRNEQPHDPEQELPFDLLVCAEGVNSSLRDFLDVEGFASDADFAVRWYDIETKDLSTSHIHRWLHKRESAPPLASMVSPCQVPLTLAFPSTNEGRFGVMIYLPKDDFGSLSPAELLQKYCYGLQCDVLGASTESTLHPTVHCEELFNSVGLPSAVMVGDAAHSCNPFWMQGLAAGLEDCNYLVNNVDAFSRHFYDAVRQYSRERGSAGDALREVTDRCLYFERNKHRNPFLRLRNEYQRLMNLFVPRYYNEFYGASVNHLYSKSIEAMMNGRGYTSYDFIDKQQIKHRGFNHFGRLYN